MARDRTPVHASAQAAPSGAARRVECKDALPRLSRRDACGRAWRAARRGRCRTSFVRRSRPFRAPSPCIVRSSRSRNCGRRRLCRRRMRAPGVRLGLAGRRREHVSAASAARAKRTEHNLRIECLPVMRSRAKRLTRVNRSGVCAPAWRAARRRQCRTSWAHKSRPCRGPFPCIARAHEAAISAAVAVHAAILRAPGIFDRRGGRGRGPSWLRCQQRQRARIEPGHGCRPSRRQVTLRALTRRLAL